MKLPVETLDELLHPQWDTEAARKAVRGRRTKCDECGATLLKRRPVCPFCEA